MFAGGWQKSVLQIEEDDESATDPDDERINFWQRLSHRQMLLLPVRPATGMLIMSKARSGSRAACVLCVFCQLSERADFAVKEKPSC